MIDIKKLVATTRNNQNQKVAAHIQEHRAVLMERLNAGRLRHADLEEALKQQGRDLDAMVGAVQMCDELLAELEGEDHASL